MKDRTQVRVWPVTGSIQMTAVALEGMKSAGALPDIAQTEEAQALVHETA